MSRAYVWYKNEWGENEKVYLNEAPPGNSPSYDMGGVAESPYEAQREWQRRNKTFIKDVHYDEENNDQYGKL